MALPGDNYTAFSGLDLDLEPLVAEYEIHPTESTFRIWGTPLETTNEGTYETEATECYTAMTFQTAKIGNYTFNLEGKDELLWAANGETTFVTYHGEARARFAIDWTTGEVTLPTPTVEEEPVDDTAADHDDHDHEEGEDHSDPSFESSAAATPTMTAFAAVVLAVTMCGI